MTGRLKVLIIDSDQTSQKLISTLLDSSYDTSFSSDEESSIAFAEKYAPDLILMDVDDDNINTGAICQQLTKCPETAVIPVVFLCNDSEGIPARMKQSGLAAVDYLTRYSIGDQLSSKIATVHSQNRRHQSALASYQDANAAAIEAMQGSGELGRVIRFAEKVAPLSSLDELGQVIIASMTALGLDSGLILQARDGELTFSSNHDLIVERSQLLKRHKDSDRIHDLDNRTIFNYKRVNLLIDNMPITDISKYGRYKDLIAAIMSLADVKVITINEHLAIKKQTLDLKSNFQMAKQTIGNIAEEIHKLHHQSTTVMELLLQDFDQKIPNMGLEDDQEALIINSLDGSIQTSLKLQTKGEHLIASFEDVMLLVQHLLDQQEELVKELTYKPDLDQPDVDPDLDEGSEVF